MNEDKVLEIYLKGCQNKRAVAPEAIQSSKRKIKVFIYYIFLVFFSPEFNIDKTIFYVNGNKLVDNDISCEEVQRIYRGYLYSKLSQIKNIPTFVGGIKKRKRFQILKELFILYKKNKEYINDFSTWMEFYFIYSFFVQNAISRVITRGHYDDVNTWISLISKDQLFEVEMYQHGIVLEEIKIPNKIEYSKVNVFDEYSKTVFEKNYVNRSSCEYCLYDFKPSCKFAKIEKESGYLYVGIGEQKNKKWILQLLDAMRPSMNKNKIKIVIMLHPNSNYKYIGDDIVVTRNKYDNLDLLITDFSTLPIDYYRANPNINVLYFKKSNCFRDYPFIYCEQFEDVSAHLDRIIKGR